jgi:CubicO group peptidase (beta-lactamase class C family)
MQAETVFQKNDPSRGGVSKSNNPLKSGNDNLVESAARKYFEGSGAVGILIGISSNGNRKYYGYGRSKLSNEALPDSNTLFETGPVTKTFTSLLLAEAVLTKKIPIDDPVKKYLPPGLLLSKNGKEITLRQLANHSSGLPNMMSNLMEPPGFDPQNPYKTYSKKYLLEYLSRNEPANLPGSRNEYSHTGAALLGLALEAIYRKPYAQLVYEKIFIPLKMGQSFLIVPQKLSQSFADGHSGTGTPVAHWDYDCMAPAGGIKSTANNMLNYLEAQITNRNKAFALCHQPTYKIDQSLSVGLAWHILDLPAGAGRLIWHNGDTGGFSSFAGFNKEKKTAVIVLANNGVLNAADPIGINILKQLEIK